MSELGDLKFLSVSLATMVSPSRNYLNYLYKKYQPMNENKVADYIPELALSKKVAEVAVF